MGRVIAVQMPELAAAERERELTAAARSGLDPGPRK